MSFIPKIRNSVIKNFTKNKILNNLKREEISFLLEKIENNKNLLNFFEKFDLNFENEKDVKEIPEIKEILLEKSHDNVNEKSINEFNERFVSLYYGISSTCNLLKNIKGKEILKEINWLNSKNLISTTEEYKFLYDSVEEEAKNQSLKKMKYNVNIKLFYLNMNSNFNFFPVHDHPGMFVFSKCLHGEMKVLSFTKKTNNSNEVELTNEKYIKKEDCCCLFPQKDNFHFIEAQEDSVLLDFFIPHYGENLNDRHYYSTNHKGKLLFELNRLE